MQYSVSFGWSHRDRKSRTFKQLMNDVHDAREITAKTRTEIEGCRRKTVTYLGSFAA